MDVVRDFNERQSELFLTVARFLTSYESRELETLVDSDVAEAAQALAGTFETASRGLIYEHRPTSAPAGRLVNALTPVLAEAGKGAGTSFERDAASVFRRIERTIANLRASEPEAPSSFLELVERTVSRAMRAGEDASAPEAPRLIVP